MPIEIPKSLKACHSLSQFNAFMSNEVKVVTGVTVGRKFTIAGKNYAMNEIVAQFKKCFKHDMNKDLNTKDDIKKGYVLLEALQESGSEKLKQAKFSKLGAGVIKMRQTLGNFFSTSDKKRILQNTREYITSHKIAKGKVLDKEVKSLKDQIAQHGYVKASEVTQEIKVYSSAKELNKLVWQDVKKATTYSPTPNQLKKFQRLARQALQAAETDLDLNPVLIDIIGFTSACARSDPNRKKQTRIIDNLRQLIDLRFSPEKKEAAQDLLQQFSELR